MKHKILIYSRTYFRDYGVSYVLAKILERMGFQCKVVTTETIFSKLTEFTKPDAVIFNTSSATPQLIKKFPNSYLYFCAAEGATDFKSNTERYFIKNKRYTKNIKKIFLWGENTKKIIIKDLKNNLEKKIITDSFKKEFLNKILISGHPRLDLMKFSKKNTKSNKIKIGFIGMCHYVNRLNNYPVITNIMDREYRKLESRIENITYSSNLMNLYIKIINSLGFQKYEYSYRPYPQESRLNLLRATIVKQKKLLISNELDFGSWLNSQDIIIGDITETFTYMYTVKKPFLAISKIIQEPRLDKIWSNPVMHKLQSKILPYMPTTFDNLIENIQKEIFFTDYPDDLIKYLKFIFGVRKDSSLLFIAKEIVNDLKSKKVNNNYMPLSIINFLDFFYKRIKKVQSYSSNNLNNLRRVKKEEFRNIVENILKKYN